MRQSTNTQIEQIFSLSTLKIFKVFDSNHNYLNNITGTAKDTNLSHVTAHRYLKAMVDLEILSEVFAGKNGKIFKLNRDSLSTKAFREFLEVLGEEVK